MRQHLSLEERTSLSERYGLRLQGEPRPCLRSIAAMELLDRAACESYLDWLGDYIGSPTRQATASTLVKRYAAIAVSPALYSMTVNNKGLMLELEHCLLETPELPEHNPLGTKLPYLSVSSYGISLPAPDQRRNWREHTVRELFAGHLTPLIRSLSEIARVSKMILWENALVRMVPLFKEAIDSAEDPTAAARIREDFRYIAREAPGELFGERRNPLSALVESTGMDREGDYKHRLRRTCCLYYKVSAEYCRQCPLPQESRE
jgi:Uncharacterized Fe-S protein